MTRTERKRLPSELKRGALPDGVYLLSVAVEGIDGQMAEDCIYMVLGAPAYTSNQRDARSEQCHRCLAERGLLGTRLG